MIHTGSDSTVPAGSGAGIMKFILAMWWAFCLPLLVSCSPPENSPEAQVRTLLKRGETATEKKETGVLRQMISEKYVDSQGQDKRAIEAILRYYFMRHDSIHLLMRIQSIAFPQPGQAQAIVLVAMAGQPISDVQELERLRADLHRFEIILANENKEWKVIRAEWRRAEPADFL
ncbi:MAG: hypothetical protein Q7J84_04790 [Sulfuricaulis sp.]|nr:hypothetical protein [Sulfuricaulis sp.]